MDRPGHQLLAGAALAQDQDGRVDRGDDFPELDGLPDRRARTEHPTVGLLPFDFGTKAGNRSVLRAKRLLLPLDRSQKVVQDLVQVMRLVVGVLASGRIGHLVGEADDEAAALVPHRLALGLDDDGVPSRGRRRVAGCIADERPADGHLAFAEQLQVLLGLVRVLPVGLDVVAPTFEIDLRFALVADHAGNTLQRVQRRPVVHVLIRGGVREPLGQRAVIGQAGRMPEPLHQRPCLVLADRLDQLLAQAPQRRGREHDHAVVLQPDLPFLRREAQQVGQVDLLRLDHGTSNR